MNTQADVIYAFTPQKLDQTAQQKVLHLEVAYKEMALVVLDMVPEGADRTTAIRRLLESKMIAIQSISHPNLGSNKEMTHVKDASAKNKAV